MDTLTRLQKFISRNNDIYLNYPDGISFLNSGAILLRWRYSEFNKCESMEEAIDIIKKFLDKVNG